MLTSRAREAGARRCRLRSLGLPVVAVAALAGCAAGCATATGSADRPSTAPPSAGTRYTASQLRAALLPRLAGATQATTPEAGSYGSLPGVKDTKSTLKGVTITPAHCAHAASTGLDSTAFNSAPAAVTSFRQSQRGISEVLLAPAASIAPRALGHKVPAGCSHYRAVAGGRTFSYVVKDERAPRVGLGAREIRVHASGAASTDIWTVIYRANGYVGAITLIGRGTTSKQAQQVTAAAYARAEHVLR